MDYSGDVGGAIQVTPLSQSMNCSALGAAYYGDYTAATTVTATLPSGTFIPHYGFEIYMNIAMVDINKNGQTWQNNVDMVATLTTTTPTQPLTQSIDISSGSSGGDNIASGKVIQASNEGCGDTSKKDVY